MHPLLVWKKVLSPRMFLGSPKEAGGGSVDSPGGAVVSASQIHPLLVWNEGFMS